VRIRTLFGLAVAAVMAVVLAAPVSAQTPSPTPQAQAPRPAPASQAEQPLKSPVEGEIVSVDATAKKITIKPLTGADLSFTYNDKTEISGAHKDAAGLATMKEGRVTVHFSEDAQTKVKTATRIVVEPKK
jgi:Cu/Ag efflux protein CusF